jgi:tRNA(Ile)-lysidine synthase
MAPLGPFAAAPRLAAGVSGGADSMALAVLADAWANARGGALVAFVVDHGLRPESALESRETVARLTGRGIAARRLVLDPVPAGPDISAAARTARYAALAEACRREGIFWLLLGHTCADQAETVLWRSLRGSGTAGLAGMAARREDFFGAVLRPLLGFSPGRLRATCRAAGLAWVSDPTNQDARFARPRLRRLLADPEGQGPAIAALARAARRHGAARAASEAELAQELAELVELRPQGFALIARPERMSPPAAQRVVRCIGGLGYPPEAAACVAMLRAGAGTMAGVQVSAAGRLGEGIVIAREPAAVAGPVPAGVGRWDARWRLAGAAPELTVGALADDGVPGRDALLGRDALPFRLAAVLPAFRDADGTVLAVPGLDFAAGPHAKTLSASFAPPEPLAGAPFLPARHGATDNRVMALQASAG